MPASSLALRRLSSTALAVSFVALTASGLVMLASDGLSFSMHPVHESFGILMVVAGAVHLVLNWRPLLGHLRARWVAAVGIVLAAAASVLLVGGLAHPVDAEDLERIEQLRGRLDE